MSNGFVHSVRVPRLYKTAANIVRNVREDRGSLKTLIYEKKHPNVSAIYALCVNTLQRGEQLDYLIRKTQILIKEPRLDTWLARVLMTELLWGKQCLQSDCKPVQTVLTYEKQLREELLNSSAQETAELCKKSVRKPRYIRINTILLSINEGITNFESEGWSLLPRCSNYASHLDALKSLSGFYFIQDFHIPEVLIFPPETSFYKHPAYLQGEIVLQDKASCLPAHLLNPEPGSVVLDLCAAPGMKTTHLAAIMKNRGNVYAVELDARRYGTLCEQVKLTDSLCVTPINNDALTLDVNQFSNVEYILIDPSCSGSGMVDRQNMDRESDKVQPERLKSLQAFQVFLLRHTLFTFPMAKRIVYSTCSINSEENEQVIDEVLSNVGDGYRLVPVQSVFGGDSWINYSSTEYNCSNKCLYTIPDVDLCNGFFVAILERNFDVPLPDYKRKVSKTVDTDQPESHNDPIVEEAKPSRNRKKRRKKKPKGADLSAGPQSVEEEKENFRVSSETEKELDEKVAEIADNEPPKKKRKKKKERERIPEGEDDEGVREKVREVQGDSNEIVRGNENGTEKKKRDKRGKLKCKSEESVGEDEVMVPINDDRIAETNENGMEAVTKKKKKKKHKRESVGEGEVKVLTNDDRIAEMNENVIEAVTKKKKKKHKRENDGAA